MEQGLNSTKQKLLKMTLEKLADDGQFMASQLNVHGVQATCTTLQCSEETVYRLGLCKLPPAGSPDEIKQWSEAAAYAGVDAGLLTTLLSALRPAPSPLHVVHKRSLEEQWFGQWRSDKHPIAAKWLEKAGRLEQALYAQLQAVPRGARRAAGLVIGIGLGLLCNATDVDHSSQYAGQGYTFSDSIAHLAVQDHTGVKWSEKDQVS